MKPERRPMDRSLKRKLVAGTVAALAVGGAGAGVAATQLRSSPNEESQAIVNDAAKQLGLQPDQLSGALKKAIENQIDAAVAAGQVAKDQGKSVDGLIAALKADLKAKLDQAVKDGRITQAQEDQALKDADTQISDLVNGKFLRPPRIEGWFGHRGDFGGRPGPGFGFDSAPAA